MYIGFYLTNFTVLVSVHVEIMYSYKYCTQFTVIYFFSARTRRRPTHSSKGRKITKYEFLELSFAQKREYRTHEDVELGSC
jgi:hypothetical protein